MYILSPVEGPCSEHHFIPILDELRAREDRDPAADHTPPTSNVQPPISRKHPNWGGRRPGAGAPRGNLNGLRHGRHSRHHKMMAQVLAQVPELQEALIAVGKRRRRHEAAAQAGAAAMLAEMLRRVGEAVLHPEDNHLEPNQDFLDMLRVHESQIRKILAAQSTEPPENSGQSTAAVGGEAKAPQRGRGPLNGNGAALSMGRRIVPGGREIQV